MVAPESDPVIELFSDAVETAGGLSRLVIDRRLGWLPSLMESACIIVMEQQQHQPLEDIADALGITRESVENVLTGPLDKAPTQIRAAPPPDAGARELIAGGLVKHALQTRV